MPKSIFGDEMIDFLSVFQDKVDIAVQEYAATAAPVMEGYAKENALWTDRTGAARQRLKGTVERYANGYRIKLAHGVEYGAMLELAHEKRFAIIEPTIVFSGFYDVMPGFEGLLEKIRRNNRRGRK